MITINVTIAAKIFNLFCIVGKLGIVTDILGLVDSGPASRCMRRLR